MIDDIAMLAVRLGGGWWLWRSRMRRMPKKGMRQRIMMWLYYRYLYSHGAFIGHTAKFSSEPCFPHSLYGVLIAGGAHVGKNCVIFHHVTIGANALPDSKGVGSPVIGDNVYIGAGAKIIGNLRVGHNCRIGANCVVTNDVPDNSVVVLPAPRVLVREQQMDNRYYRWTADGPEYFDEGTWIKAADAKVDKLRNAL